VSKKSRDTDIIRDISLSVMPREFVGILGPSGSGKSTLLNIMNGNLRPLTGAVNLNNTDFNTNYQSFKNLVGFVPQEDIVHSELTVYKTLFYAASLRLPDDLSAEEKNKRVEKILSILELDERRNHPIHSLSGGQKKRVNLGVELLTEPSILFLDEPTSGLDPGLEQKMMQLFRRIADNGQTVIMATHLLNEIQLFDLVAIIFEGNLVYYGPPAELTHFFKVEKPNDVYNRLYFPPEDGWVKRFKTSVFYRDYVLARLKTGPEKPAGKDKDDIQAFESMVFFNPTYSSFRQFKILAKRYLDIIFHDPVNVLLLLGQAPVIGLLFVLVFMNYRNAWSLLFCFSLAAVWFGCINSVREITKEKHIYARERVVSLKVVPYLFSKIFVLLMLCLIQCVVLIVLVTIPVKVEGSHLLMFLTVFISSLAGLSLGLMVSAMVGSSDKALALLPILLIPQILFSGTVVEIDNMMSVSQFVSNFMILRWSYDLMKKISVWESGGFVFDANFLFLTGFLPLFILAALFFQKRKDIRR
jgi:ABC-type multidrug transport system ATPase subunit